MNRHLDAGSYRYFRDAGAVVQGCYALKLQAGAEVSVIPIRIAR